MCFKNKSSNGYMKHVGDVNGQRNADVVVTVETARWVSGCHGAQGGGALQGVVVDGAQQVLLVQRRESQRPAEPAGRQQGRGCIKLIHAIIPLFSEYENANCLQHSCDFLFLEEQTLGSAALESEEGNSMCSGFK